MCGNARRKGGWHVLRGYHGHAFKLGFERLVVFPRGMAPDGMRPAGTPAVYSPA